MCHKLTGVGVGAVVEEMEKLVEASSALLHHTLRHTLGVQQLHDGVLLQHGQLCFQWHEVIANLVEMLQALCGVIVIVDEHWLIDNWLRLLRHTKLRSQLLQTSALHHSAICLV